MHILQITDPHLYGNASGNLRGVETDSSLRNVLDSALVETAGYAAIVVTGDIVQDDTAGYLRFKSILGNLRTPVLCIPGNHDQPEVMRRSLTEEPFQYCGTRRLGDWQLILLDSYDPGQTSGKLGLQELERLDTALASSPAHALVCLHHHPVDMGSRWLDGIGLNDAAAFWRIIDSHRHVRGIAWGHVHQAYDGMRNGVHLFATPSTCAQFLPRSDLYAVDSRPPAYRLFDLHSDGRIHSEVRWIKPFRAHLTLVR